MPKDEDFVGIELANKKFWTIEEEYVFKLCLLNYGGNHEPII